MVYPIMEDSGRFKTKWMFGLWTDPSQQPARPPPLKSRDMSVVCLNIYLEKEKDMLSKGKFSVSTLDMGVLYERIIHVYKSLKEQWIYSSKSLKGERRLLDKSFREV